MITPQIQNMVQQPGKELNADGKTKEFPDMQTSEGQETDARDLQGEGSQAMNPQEQKAGNGGRTPDSSLQ